jgi:hypothetical protein
MSSSPRLSGCIRLGNMSPHAAHRGKLCAINARYRGRFPQHATLLVIAGQPDRLHGQARVELADAESKVAGRAATARFLLRYLGEPVLRRPQLNEPVTVQAPCSAGDETAQLSVTHIFASAIHQSNLGGHNVSCGVAAELSPGTAPVMIATASAIVCRSGVVRATRRPSRMMWIRSAMSKTCGMLWLRRITNSPRARIEHLPRLTPPRSG